jgi:hypothetical protein
MWWRIWVMVMRCWWSTYAESETMPRCGWGDVNGLAVVGFWLAWKVCGSALLQAFQECQQGVVGAVTSRGRGGLGGEF